MMTNHRLTWQHQALLALLAGLSLPGAQAQSTSARPRADCRDDMPCSEVTVTAQYRAQDLNEVPLSITRIDGASLQRDGVVDLGQLTTRVPGFAANTHGIPSLYLRGIGSNDLGAGGDPSVGVYLDGVYVGRSTGALFDLLDVQRIEVIRGPQGVLYGRNSAGGAINVITQSADTTGNTAQLGVQLGNWNERRVQAIGNLALGNDWGWRVAADHLKRDGYIHNAFFHNDLIAADQWSLRTSLNYAPTPALTLQLQVGGENKDTDGTSSRSSNQRYLTGTPFDDYYSDLDHGFERRRIRYAHLHGNYQGTDWQLHTSSSYRTIDYADLVDSTGTGLFNRRLYAGSDERYRQLGQDVVWQWATQLGAWPTHLTLGASYYRQRVDQQSHLESTSDTVNFAVSRQLGTNVTVIPPGRYHEENSLNDGNGQSSSVFVDATLQLTPRWQWINGIRYNHDRKQHMVDGQGSNNGLAIVFTNTPALTGQASWREWTPRSSINVRIDPRTLLYLSFNEGYKSGGFNSFVGDVRFAPEHIDQWELGSKWSSPQQRLQLQIALYDYRYRDLQVSVIEAGKAVIRNAARAHGKGADIEASLQWNDHWRTSLSGGWLQAEFTDFISGTPARNLAGNQLTFSPDKQLSSAVDYQTTLKQWQVTATLRHSYTGEQYFDVSNTPSARENAVHLLDASVSLAPASARWRATVYGKNLTDTHYVTNIGGLAKDTLDAPASKRGMPRSYGLRWEASWR